MLIQGNAHSLVVKGTAGVGKTHTVLEALKEAGYEEEVHYIYITGFITPLQLFNTLSKCSTLESPKLFVFDDLEGIIGNKTCVALLKSALWEARGKRIVSYQSSTNKLDNDGSIDFDGKVLLILNSLKEESVFGKSLLDRGIFYEMRLSGAELTSYVEDILPLVGSGLADDIKAEVWRQVKRFASNQSFSLRSLTRAFEFYKYNKDDWFTLFLNTLKLSSDQKVFYQIQENDKLSDTEKAKVYKELTGRSERTYHRQKKIL